VGEVARAMIARMPDWLRLGLFPPGSELIAVAHDAAKRGIWVTLITGERKWVPQNGRAQFKQWRETTAILQQNTLKIAEYIAPKAVSKSQIAWLGDYFYLGKLEYNESDMLRVALVGDDDKLHSLDGTLVNDKYQLSYNAYLGYLAKKWG
jgi:CRISPR-associated endonuclease/helicase Cas3